MSFDMPMRANAVSQVRRTSRNWNGSRTTRRAFGFASSAAAISRVAADSVSGRSGAVPCVENSHALCCLSVRARQRLIIGTAAADNGSVCTRGCVRLPFGSRRRSVFACRSTSARVARTSCADRCPPSNNSNSSASRTGESGAASNAAQYARSSGSVSARSSARLYFARLAVAATGFD